jgi:lysozyme
MIKVCAAGPVVKGVDVSHYQRNVVWPAVKASGHEFAFIKASEGLTRRDPLYRQHRNAAEQAGLMVGAYHFFRAGQNPVEQARHFVNTIGVVNGPQDLPPVLDWETTEGKPDASDVLNGVAFLNELKRLTGRTPIIYTGPYFFQALGAYAVNYGLEQYPLWIAHYGTKCPLVPAPFKTWAFHQYSDKGHVPGVGTDHDGEDADLFNGTLEQLKALV